MTVAALASVGAASLLALFATLLLAWVAPATAAAGCRTHRARARLRDTPASLAARFHIDEAALRARNGLGPGEELRHRRRYVVADATMGEVLRDGVSLGASDATMIVVDPQRAYGQPFVVALLRQAAAAGQAFRPGGARVVIEDVSLPAGGCMPPHLEHRGGREADVGLYLRGEGEARRLRRATARSFDADRQWRLLHVLLRSGCVQRMLLDRRLIRPLRAAAARAGVSPRDRSRWLGPLPGASRAVLRAASGHDNHVHVRFAEGGRCSAAGAAAVELPEAVTP